MKQKYLSTSRRFRIALHSRADQSVEAHQRWAVLIKRVYEVDPLECPECGSEMTIVAFIWDPAVVNTILDQLGMLELSGNDPPRRSPDSGRHHEPIDDDLSPGDERRPDG